MNILIFSFLFLFVLIPQGKCNSAYLKSQYAGEIGFLSFGIGTQYYTYGSIDVLYGVIPEDIGGEKIETIAFKNQVRFAHLEYAKHSIKPYFGASVYRALGSKYQTSENGSGAPKNYYSDISTMYLYYMGSEFHKSNNEGSTVYFEAGINGRWINLYFENEDNVTPSEHVSLALGYRLFI